MITVLFFRVGCLWGYRRALLQQRWHHEQPEFDVFDRWFRPKECTHGTGKSLCWLTKNSPNQWTSKISACIYSEIKILVFQTKIDFYIISRTMKKHRPFATRGKMPSQSLKSWSEIARWCLKLSLRIHQLMTSMWQRWNLYYISKKGRESISKEVKMAQL